MTDTTSRQVISDCALEESGPSHKDAQSPAESPHGELLSPASRSAASTTLQAPWFWATLEEDPQPLSSEKTTALRIPEKHHPQYTLSCPRRTLCCQSHLKSYFARRSLSFKETFTKPSWYHFSPDAHRYGTCKTGSITPSVQNDKSDHLFRLLT